MSKLTFKLRGLTPMFMGGADPHGQPELRAASIRGVMRFWFRTIAGAITDDPKEVYKLESEIFGNEGKRSSISIRVRKDVKDYRELYSKQKVNTWVAYLANIGLARPGKGFVRKAIAPDTEFWIDITGVEPAEEIGISILEIAAYLGGFGARWRHGFGSCEIINGQRILTPSDLNGLVDKIHRLLERIAKSLEINLRKTITLPTFPVFIYPYVEVWEGRLPLESNSWDEILSYIGQKYREFRSNNDIKKKKFRNTRDFREIIRPIFENKPHQSDPKNDVFGLPIQFRDKITSKVAILNVENREKNIGRRASPLILHVEPDRKLLRATIFKSKFIPDDKNTHFYVEYKNRKIPLKKPTENDYARIIKFVGDLLQLTRRYPNA